jgi:hypothetical protein
MLMPQKNLNWLVYLFAASTIPPLSPRIIPILIIFRQWYTIYLIVTASLKTKKFMGGNWSGTSNSPPGQVPLTPLFIQQDKSLR